MIEQSINVAWMRQLHLAACALRWHSLPQPALLRRVVKTMFGFVIVPDAPSSPRAASAPCATACAPRLCKAGFQLQQDEDHKIPRRLLRIKASVSFEIGTKVKEIHDGSHGSSIRIFSPEPRKAWPASRAFSAIN